MSKSKARRRPRQQRPSSPFRLYIIGALVTLAVVGTVIVIALATSGGNDSPPDTVVVPTARPADVTQDGHLLGDSGAQVLVVEYLDFQCPFCRRASAEIMPAIEESFIATGVAKLELRPIAILGDESVQAAAAAECANEQGQFWAYHDMLFANQGAERSGAFSDERLTAFANELGLDTDSFGSCLDSGRYTGTVEEATAAARNSGVSVTPTVLVNGEMVDTTIEAISSAIQQATGS